VADSSYLVGLISDTHGLMRQDALDALRGSDLIIHAGDIGDPAVLESLAGLAPIRAIRGNNDKGSWAAQLPKTEIVEFGPHSIYVLHDLAELDLDPAAAGFTTVVSGHSHKPVIQERGTVLFVNPGSAGPRRFSLPVTVATMRLSLERRDATIIQLYPAAK
jgi:putative phosphoesterase